MSLSAPVTRRLPIVGLLLLLVATGAVPARAGEPAMIGSDLSATVLRTDKAARYWTRSRMRKATSRVVNLPSGSVPEPTIMDRSVGEPGSVPASHAGGRRNAALPTGSGPSATSAYDYPFPFTRYKVPGVLKRKFPYRTVGKIFFTMRGFDHVCSGSAVPGAVHEVVFTAGHCLNDGFGNFAERLIFVPGYFKGRAPFGKFPAIRLWTTPEWNSGSGMALRRDMGAFSVGPNRRGYRLGQRVGHMGFAWNQTSGSATNSRALHWNLFGYPVLNFGGKRMFVCQASHATDDDSLFGVGPATMGVGCDFTGGASGGPWVLGLRTDDLVNGVNSYVYAGLDALYSPYFDEQANRLRCAAALDNPNPPANC